MSDREFAVKNMAASETSSRKIHCDKKVSATRVLRIPSQYDSQRLRRCTASQFCAMDQPGVGSIL